LALMDEWEEGKQKFIGLVQGVDASVQVVIPTKPTNSMFLISLTKGPNRKFMTLPEDDMIDLSEDAGVLARVMKAVNDAVSAL
jgi:hypothetical protein